MSDQHRLYASSALRSLFVRELTMLAPILSGVFGNRGLFLRPHPDAPDALPEHLLSTMHAAAYIDGRMDGATRFDTDAFPFANDSFKLVIAQHVFEQIGDAQATASEIARVLAPEGVALIFGFNPISPWRFSLDMQAWRAGLRLRLRSAPTARTLLMREQIDTLQVRYPGSWWPSAADSAVSDVDGVVSSAFARFRSSWLLLARKRRSTLTPLRMSAGARELTLKPRLAPGAQRARA